MQKKKNTTTFNNGFDNLLNVHMSALEENSKSIVDMLQILSKKSLSSKDKKELKFIKKELNRMNKDLDNLGEDEYGI